MDSGIHAAIDANINRFLEGIRVCEDIFRFVVRDTTISVKLKEIRHELINETKFLSYGNLIHGRDVESDSQKFVDLQSEKIRKSIHDLAKSNLHRAMEATRSLEEFIKLVQPDLQNNPFQKIRFSIYSLEKEMIPLLLRQDKRKHFNFALYAILDSFFVADEEYARTTGRLIKGGATIIQLRIKNHSMSAILNTAKEVCNICKENDVVFIVNDYPEIAYLSDADGVHLGQDDLSVPDVRRLLAPDKIIGLSTHSLEQAVIASELEPDYIAVGPIYETKSKNNKLIDGIGENIVKDVLSGTQIPVVAIGGLNPERISRLKDIGCTCNAVISYLFYGDKIEENCRQIVNIIKGL